MNIIDSPKLNFKDVMILPRSSTIKSRGDVDVSRVFKTKNSNIDFAGVPIIAANLDTVGQFGVACVLAKHKIFTAIHKFYKLDQWYDFMEMNGDIAKFTYFTIGMSDTDFEKLNTFYQHYNSEWGMDAMPSICIDIANGYIKDFQDYIAEIRNLYKTIPIMAGNVCTPEGVKELLSAGADFVKVGIGPGSMCTTTAMTAIGCPQLSAVIECAQAAHEENGHIVADGGCKQTSDIIKALGAGADLVMLGSMLAAHDECEGHWLMNEGVKTSMKVYGMSSKEAMDTHYGGIASYRAAEGRCEWMPYKGRLDDTISNIQGGIRSACSYVGVSKIKDFSKCSTFIRVT